MIILVSGKKNSGKDFVAAMLKNAIYDSEVISFAEPMKDILCTTLNVTRDDFDRFKNHKTQVCIVDDEVDNYFYTTDVRRLIQNFGSEAMKKWFGVDVWAKMLSGRVKKGKVTIVSDWRFLVEYDELIKEHDVVTVRIDSYNTLADGDSHDSEVELDKFNFDIRINNSDKQRAPNLSKLMVYLNDRGFLAHK